MIDLDLNLRKDERGLLGFLELPFTSRRFALTSAVNVDSRKGGHALKFSEEIIFLISGSCQISTHEIDGSMAHRNLLDIGKGILIKPMVYRELSRFSTNCVLLHCYSMSYNPQEYIYSPKELIEYRV